MEQHNIHIPIYADNQAEAEQCRQAIIDFIVDLRQCGCAVKADKVTESLKSWRSNPIVASAIIKKFKI